MSRNDGAAPRNHRLRPLIDASRIASPYWGKVALELERVYRWRMGPLTLLVQRLHGEWRLVPCTDPDAMAPGAEAAVPAEREELADDEELLRFAVSGEDTTLEVLPLLADRPVVTRPERPFHLPVGEETLVFVSSPLWLRVQQSHPLRLLCELPVFRPSDTWFGPSTLEGELCYASRTTLRMGFDRLPLRPHRAITAVRILNRGQRGLDLHTLKLPVPHLALYSTPDGNFWTQDVTFEHTGQDTFAALRLRDRHPRLAPGAARVTEPRESSLDNPVVRVFSALFNT